MHPAARGYRRVCDYGDGAVTFRIEIAAVCRSPDGEPVIVASWIGFVPGPALPAVAVSPTFWEALRRITEVAIVYLRLTAGARN